MASATKATKSILIKDNIENMTDVQLALTAVAHIFSGGCDASDVGRAIKHEINHRLYEGAFSDGTIVLDCDLSIVSSQLDALFEKLQVE